MTHPRAFEYSITPSVDMEGSPTWTLWRSWVYSYGASGTPSLLAVNKDRAVLETAIKHLESSPYYVRP